MDVKDFLEAVGGVSMEVGFEGAEGFIMEELVFFDKGLELLLDACQFVLCEFVVIELDLCMDEML